MGKCSYLWRRLASAAWEDAWEERLRFLGTNLVCFQKPGSRFVRFEAWCDESTGRRLLREFGGSLREMKNPPPANTPGPPIRIRNRFEIRDPAMHNAEARPARHTLLWIPAGTAFGTGAHATTATLLRMLCDLSLPAGCRAFDAGTGSGILAIAMEKLGAARVLAVDNDPAAVRTARENFRRNHCKNCRAEKKDALSPPPHCHIITANLFSSLLIRAAEPFAKALEPTGWLLFSGVLRSQWDEVQNALHAAGLRVEERRVVGKWCSGAARRISPPSATPAR